MKTVAEILLEADYITKNSPDRKERADRLKSRRKELRKLRGMSPTAGNLEKSERRMYLRSQGWKINNGQLQNKGRPDSNFSSGSISHEWEKRKIRDEVAMSKHKTPEPKASTFFEGPNASILNRIGPEGFSPVVKTGWMWAAAITEKMVGTKFHNPEGGGVISAGQVGHALCIGTRNEMWVQPFSNLPKKYEKSSKTQSINFNGKMVKFDHYKPKGGVVWAARSPVEGSIKASWDTLKVTPADYILVDNPKDPNTNAWVLERSIFSTTYRPQYAPKVQEPKDHPNLSKRKMIAPIPVDRPGQKKSVVRKPAKKRSKARKQ